MACPSIPQATTGDSRHGYMKRLELLPQLWGRPRPQHMPVETSFGHASKQLHTPWAAPELPPCPRQGQVSVPPAHSQLLPTGLLDLAEEGGCEGSCSGGSGGFANGSKAFPPGAGGKRGHSRRGASREVGGRRWQGRREAGVAACKETEKRGYSAGRGVGGQGCALGKA